MPILKCKICGGTLEFEQGATVGVCDSCGTKQTLPVTEDEILGNLFNRATTLRLKCEFDKAEELYGKILEKDPANAEAHWGVILCKYGIEYVEDPKTYRRVPTCHRTSFDAILADEDYKAALENADITGRELYETEAREIDRIQRDILSVVKDEKPFDVFICYKETDENGKRTQDSAIANDIYYQLTREGFKVFYAAITLEDKLGQEYEPYIFAALNSAKVMLVIGSKPEYFSSVWVKNEWSRFLKLMKANRDKLLIPCYKDMDAYELPEEFAHLQAQDMSKIGFINDIVRGIKKVAGGNIAPEAKAAVPVAEISGNVQALLDRGFMALEDGEWQKADDFFEQALNYDAKLPSAYLGKLMAEKRVCKQDRLKDCAAAFDGSGNYQKALRFADPALAETLKGYIACINERNETARLTDIYNNAKNAMNAANTEAAFKAAADTFSTIPGFEDADELAQQCRDKAEASRKNDVYAFAKASMSKGTIVEYVNAINVFRTISGWKDSDEQVLVCEKKIEEIRTKEEAARLEAERKVKERRIAAEKRAKVWKRVGIAVLTVLAICALLYISPLRATIVSRTCKHKNCEWVITKEPTCTTLGERKNVCAKCGSVQAKEQIECIPHIVVDDPAVKVTCEEDGLTKGSHCEVCGKIIEEQTVITKTGHKFKSVEILRSPTCTIPGQKKEKCIFCQQEVVGDTPALGHNFCAPAPTCTERGVCARCGETCDPQHKYCETVIREMVCDENQPGESTFTCFFCGDSYTAIVPAEHKYVDGVCVMCKQIQP